MTLEATLFPAAPKPPVQDAARQLVLDRCLVSQQL